MDECVVEIASWEMQCCGKPFAIGGSVEWYAYKWENNWSPVVDVGEIDYVYDHHTASDEDLFIIRGVVARIKAVFYDYELAKDRKVYIPVSGKIVDIDSANGWNKYADGKVCSSYYVTLHNVTIEPAPQDDENNPEN
ncbi:hypothetical protein FACS189487_03390 [Campylobacterota bacterium]|nr:hypothetical protein FACS189487_03390 [Campylobacterota bacterium]